MTHEFKLNDTTYPLTDAELDRYPKSTLALILRKIKKDDNENAKEEKGSTPGGTDVVPPSCSLTSLGNITKDEFENLVLPMYKTGYAIEGDSVPSERQSELGINWNIHFLTGKRGKHIFETIEKKSDIASDLFNHVIDSGIIERHKNVGLFECEIQFPFTEKENMDKDDHAFNCKIENLMNNQGIQEELLALLEKEGFTAKIETDSVIPIVYEQFTTRPYKWVTYGSRNVSIKNVIIKLDWSPSKQGSPVKDNNDCSIL